jgi:hypothetical protein
LTIPNPQQPAPHHPLPLAAITHSNAASVPASIPPQQQEQSVPLPAELIDETCARARSKMRRAVLSQNGMPTNDENIIMARTALLDAIASGTGIPPVRYYLPDEENFITSLTKITNTIRTSIKSAARTVVRCKYDLELDIWDSSSEVTHKLLTVPALITHLQCLFKMAVGRGI